MREKEKEDDMKKKQKKWILVCSFDRNNKAPLDRQLNRYQENKLRSLDMIFREEMPV